MTQLLLVLSVVLAAALVGYVVATLVTGDDPGLVPAEPDGRAVPLPNDRALVEEDLARVRFDVVLRGYRMSQVDRALRRAAYDIGYKDELIRVLQAEVEALREGRRHDAEALRRAREAAVEPPSVSDGEPTAHATQVADEAPSDATDPSSDVAEEPSDDVVGRQVGDGTAQSGDR